MDVEVEEREYIKREEVLSDNLVYSNTKKTEAIQLESSQLSASSFKFYCILLNLFFFPVITKRHLFYLRPVLHLCCGFHPLLLPQGPCLTKHSISSHVSGSNNYSISNPCLQFLPLYPFLLWVHEELPVTCNTQLTKKFSLYFTATFCEWLLHETAPTSSLPIYSCPSNAAAVPKKKWPLTCQI